MFLQEYIMNIELYMRHQDLINHCILYTLASYTLLVGTLINQLQAYPSEKSHKSNVHT